MQSCAERVTNPEYLQTQMHEVSIMTEAVRMAAQAAQAAGATRITMLTLRVGALSGADSEALRFAWDVVAAESIAAGAKLVIEPVPAIAWCSHCAEEFSLPKVFGECPRCHGFASELRRGKELELGVIEVE